MSLLPPEVTPGFAIVLVVLSYFTSALTAVVGVGGGIFLISVMASFLPPAIVIPIHAVVQLGSNGGRAALMRRDIDWRIAMLFAMGAIVGIVVAAKIFVALTTQTLQLLLGLFILVSIWTPKFKGFEYPHQRVPAGGCSGNFLHHVRRRHRTFCGRLFVPGASGSAQGRGHRRLVHDYPACVEGRGIRLPRVSLSAMAADCGGNGNCWIPGDLERQKAAGPDSRAFVCSSLQGGCHVAGVAAAVGGVVERMSRNS